MAQEVSRRSFLKLAAATGAAVAVPGCKPAARHLVPYVVPDENVTPGLPSFYATTCAECPAGCGVVARVREGRVTKLEGNPIDPIGAGALCARGQAALQELYNPDRLPAPRRRETDGRGTPLNWRNALREFNAQLKAAAAAGKDRVLFIGQPQGPTLRKITEAWLKTYNSQRFVAFEAINYQALTEAAQRCFNRQDRPVYQLDRAEVIVSFGADFLETYLSPVEYTRQFAAFRAPRKAGEQTTMGLALYVGPRMNLTAANSDQWFACRAGNEGAVALAVLRAVVDSGALHPQSGLDANALRQFTAGYEPEAVAKRSGVPVSVIQAIAQRVTKARSAVALAAADDLAGQMGAMLLNTATGNLGNTMRFIDAPNLTWASSRGEIADAVKAMHDGAVDVLVVAAVNPVFTLPPELSTAQAMRRVKLVVWAGWVPDETAEFAHLLLPIDHPLESWDDASPLPGVARLRQPVTRRVFDSRALGDLMLDSIAQAGVNPPPVAWKDTQEALKATWHEIQTQVAPNTSFDDFWAKALSEGGVFTELKTASLTPRGENHSHWRAFRISFFTTDAAPTSPGYRKCRSRWRRSCGTTGLKSILTPPSGSTSRKVRWSRLSLGTDGSRSPRICRRGFIQKPSPFPLDRAIWLTVAMLRAGAQIHGRCCRRTGWSPRSRCAPPRSALSWSVRWLHQACSNSSLSSRSASMSCGAVSFPRRKSPTPNPGRCTILILTLSMNGE
jgi:anaerobic selenocysteine-containing dehydrogenase